jgi:hypothetical protein
MRALGSFLAMLLFAGCSASDPKTTAVDGGTSTPSPDGAPGATGSTVAADGYITAGPWTGYGFTATDPGAAMIIPDCASGTCSPAFTGSSFCMKGTVTGRPDYTGFAMLGWNLNQAATAGASQLTWAVPSSGGVIVTVDNPGATVLRVQLQGTNPHDGSDRWCAALTSGQLIPWSSFVTNCWQGGTPQNPLTPGTMLQQGSIIVPGTLAELPFDLCLTNLQIEP